MAGNNSINRWKEGVGVPQSEGGGGFGRRTEGAATGSAETPAKPHSYLTPTSEQFQTKVTLVAPLLFDEAAGKATRQTVFARPKLESRSEVEARPGRRPPAHASPAAGRGGQGPRAAGRRCPRKARCRSGCGWWPTSRSSGKRLVASTRFADEKGDLSPLLKAQVSWIIARQDRAWYALGQAQRRLKELGQTDDQIYRPRRPLGRVLAEGAGPVHGRPQSGRLAGRADRRRSAPPR